MNALARLGAAIAHEQDALRAAHPVPDHVRQTLVELQLDVVGRDLPARRAVSLRRVAFGSVGTALLAVAAAWLVWLRPAPPSPLTLRVGAGAQHAGAGAWLEAPKSEALPLRFSDGTHIDMAPRTRVRVVELGNYGAHLSLESGLAHVKVSRLPHAAWRVSAGPFAVRITGTRFDLRWNPEQDDFELDLTEGHVEVSGCVLGSGFKMSAGQTVHASCRRGHFDVVDAGARARVAGTPSTAGPLAVVAVPEPVVASTEAAPARAHNAGAHAGSSERALSWRALAAKGQFREAFAAANIAGWDRLCASVSADDLGLLADSARYAGDVSKQAQVLGSLRKRFARRQSAALAAFALGRLEFDDHGAYRKAAGWFLTYLKEQPHGALAREARGRLMEATLRAGDVSAARVLAERYLHDYPTGPHAKLAERIAQPATP